jgi:RNA polymerase sigma-70 factor (ECF subfamily)
MMHDQENLASISDTDLVARFRESRDTRFFGELARRHRALIYRCCHRSLGNKTLAEDLTQDSLIRAFRNIDRFSGGDFRAWLYTIARRLCLNYLKSGSATREMVTSRTSDAMPRSTLETAQPLTQDQVRAILAILPEEQRICLKLLYIDGLNYEEIAVATTYSKKQVKSYVQNGRRRFKLLWKQCRQGDTP